MRWVANIVYLLAGIAYLPWLLYEMIFLGKNRRGWRQRFGGVPHFDRSRKRIWIHAVSLGEMNATRELVAQLRQRRPELDIVFSSTTDTGFARGVELYGDGKIFRYPLDLSFVVSRALSRINPTMLVLVEQEVWYNLVHIADRRGIPVAIVNGRLTERSAHRLSKLGSLTHSMFSRIRWVGAQDDITAKRFAALGAPETHVKVTSSLKWDSAHVADRIDGADALAEALGIDKTQPLWVCGSTGPGEEEIILGAYAQFLQENEANKARSLQPFPSNKDRQTQPALAIIPRKPERFDDVARLITAHGFSCVRRTAHPDGRPAPDVSEDSVILGDTMGELRKFYSLANVVFVGRSLVPMGGSDPMEVAALGKPIIVGPHMDNFAMPVRALEEAGAIRQVRSANELGPALQDLLSKASGGTAIGERARKVVLDNQGATQRTVDALLRVLEDTLA